MTPVSLPAIPPLPVNPTTAPQAPAAAPIVEPAAVEPAAAEPTAAEQRLPHLLVLRELATATGAVDLGTSDITTAARALHALGERTLATLVAIQAIDAVDVDLDDLPDDAWLGGDGPSQARRLVGDVCFASTLELRRVVRELEVATDPDDLAVAAETTRRKLRRGIRAVLEGAREAGDPDILGGEHQGRHQVTDLAPALVVRRMYATFRRALREPTDDSPEAMLMAVRYAGGALAALLTSPDYAELRASDRIVLRRLRERVLAWARERKSVVEGQRILADVATTADLLRGINRRQELRAHDRGVLERTADGPTHDVRAWLAALDLLIGLDDALDDLLARARAATYPEQLVPDLLERLAHLR